MLLPILLGLAGGAVDLARSYQAWLTIESATRDAAEYVASHSCTSAACTTNTASADAQSIVCSEAQSAPGFSGTSTTCTSPSITATVSASSTATGATGSNPIITAQVNTSLQFRTLVPWPLLPNGTITLRSNRQYAVIWGR
jgi:Flp pilus assembly protein TadG